MSFGLRHFKPLIVGAVAGLFALPALADPPGRVGRLSDMAGVVSFHDQGDEQWSPAALNYPVTAGNSFWTEPESRAEIHVGSTAIHLDASTELDVTALDDQSFEATLPQGTINIRVLHFNNRDGCNITTPRGVVTLASPGTYQISAGTDSDRRRVAVLDGAAQVVDPNSTVSLTRGEALLTGTDAIEYEIAEAQPTPFDNASLARERREDEQARAAIRYVSPEMTGYGISTITVRGATSLVTVRSGIRRRCRPTGRPIATVIGVGSSRGAGRGSTTSLGGSRRSITAAGPISATAGAGLQARSSPVRSMRRPLSPSSAASIGACRCRGVTSRNRLVSARPARSMCRPIRQASPMCATST